MTTIAVSKRLTSSRRFGSGAAAGLALPDAPTLGTITVTGPSSVLVAFSAPSYKGTSAISLYTVVSSPGNITATGSTSPISVSGLTNGVAYKFTVYATNSSGNSKTSPQSTDTVPTIVYAAATGGTVTTSGNYKIHTFTTVGANSFVVTGAGPVEVLVVGGGGGGGGNVFNTAARADGGGGGGGGVVYNSSFVVTPQTYAITVAAGVGTDTAGTQSKFGTVTANGGGAGGTNATAAGGGTSGNGFGGGGGVDGGAQNTRGAGGGGGASVGGGSAINLGGAFPRIVGGAGGTGAGYDLASGAPGGALVYYGGGGGGGVPGPYDRGMAGGAGGLGGGGGGAMAGDGGAATYYGGGGGGAGANSAGGVNNGGAGFQGIVIVRYLFQ